VRRFAAVLREPHVTPLLAAVVLARMPIGINGLAVLLYVRASRDSFALAGAVVGALSLGTGVGAPLLGRAIDRLGAGRVLVPSAIVHAAALAGLFLATGAGAPAVGLLVLGCVVGMAIPPTSAVLRSLWPRLLADTPHLLPTGFALDTILIEVVFVVGPLVTGVLAVTAGPEAALAVSGASALVGTVAFTRDPVRERPAGERRAGRLGALASPGIRTLVLSTLPVGVAFGTLEVTLPAFADEHGQAALGGVLIAVWSAGSLAGGLLYGARGRRRPLTQVHLMLAAALPLGILPILAAPSVWAMALLVVPAGLCVAPLIATRNELVGSVAVAGARTESYTWPVTALVAGIALGSAMAGSVVEAAGWREAAMLGAMAAVAGALVVLARRTTLAVASG
jgi:MFS family permease